MTKEKLSYQKVSTIEEAKAKAEERRELEENYKNFKPYNDLAQLDEWKKVEELMKEDIYNNLHHTEDGVWYHRSWGMKMFIESVIQRAEAFRRAEARLSGGEV